MSQLLTSTTVNLNAANQTSTPISMLNANVTVWVGGPGFVGTIQLQCLYGGKTTGWVNLGAPITAVGVTQVVGLAGDLQFQLVCTAYTSGLAACYLAACPTS